MVPRIGSSRPRRFFVEQWVDASGLSYEAIGLRLDPPVARNTVWRWVKEPWRLNPEKMAALAAAIGVEPQDFWRLPPPKDEPPRPSVDRMLEDADPELFQTAVDIVQRLTRRAS
jgi:hypothetical protein